MGDAMNSFSLSKLLTAVLFVFIAGGTLEVFAQSKSQSAADKDEFLKIYKSCLKTCGENTYELNCSAKDFTDAGDRRSCMNKLVATCKDDCKTDYNAGIADKKESVKTCTDAMKDWRDKASAGTRACGAFDKSIGSNCTERIRACKSKIDGTFSNDEDGEGSASLGIIKQIVMQKLSTNSNSIANDVVMGGTACVKSFDAKIKKENEKDFARERRELEARIKKEKDEELKQNEKLREKKDDITKKITELESKLKKAAESRASKASEAKTAYQKKLVDSAKVIRNLGTAILQEDQKLTKARFTVQTALLELTDDKISNLCKQQLTSIRNAILSNSPSAGVTSAEKEQISGLKSNIGTGAKGTANMNDYLKKMKETCFQQQNSKKTKLTITSYTRGRIDCRPN